MKKDEVLIIFVKNLVPGKVKTRLAAAIGEEGALRIYKELVYLTFLLTKDLSYDKIVFYSDHVETEDVWSNGYRKALQEGNDLGERMSNAFQSVFQQGYKKAVIIGTDCATLNERIFNETFTNLDTHDVVIGPAFDGGYYLLGMKTLYKKLFDGIAWSTDTVFPVTEALCKESGLRYHLLPVLHDIDNINDLSYLKINGE